MNFNINKCDLLLERPEKSVTFTFLRNGWEKLHFEIFAYQYSRGFNKEVNTICHKFFYIPVFSYIRILLN